MEQKLMWPWIQNMYISERRKNVLKIDLNIPHASIENP